MKKFNNSTNDWYCHVPLVNNDLQDMAAAHRDIAQGVRIQALQKSQPLTLLAQTLAISKRSILKVASPEQLILERVGVSTTHGTAGAQLTSMIDGLNESNFWLRADPVYWQTGPEGIFVNLDQEPEITIEQAQNFYEELAPWLDHYGFELATPHPQRWYIGQKKPFHLHTTPLSQVVGKDASEHMPTGADASRWRQLLTELQMVLQQSSNNDKLVSEHKTPVNSLWLWGEGSITGSTKQRKLLIVSDEAYCQGLANYCQLTHWPMFLEYAELKPKINPCDQVLSIHGAMTIEDMVQWQQFWLRPMLNDLMTKRIQSLAIYLGSDEIYRIQNNWFTRRKVAPILSRN